jgi:hypothetical protein
LIINAFGPLLKSGAKRFSEGVYGTFILIRLATFSKGWLPAGPKNARPKCDYPVKIRCLHFIYFMYEWSFIIKLTTGGDDDGDENDTKKVVNGSFQDNSYPDRRTVNGRLQYFRKSDD